MLFDPTGFANFIKTYIKSIALMVKPSEYVEPPGSP